MQQSGGRTEKKTDSMWDNTEVLQRVPGVCAGSVCIRQGLNNPPMAPMKYLEEGLFAKVQT